MISVIILPLSPIVALPANASGTVDHFKIDTGGATDVWERDIEFIYLDADADSVVSIDDVRIAPPIGLNVGSVVTSEDSDIGNDLYALANPKITGGDANWASGEGFYIDANTVLDSDGDTYLDWSETPALREELVVGASLETLNNAKVTTNIGNNPIYEIGEGVYISTSDNVTSTDAVIVAYQVGAVLTVLDNAKVSTGGTANVYNAGEGVFKSWDNYHTMDDTVIKSPTLTAANNIKVTNSSNASTGPGAPITLTIDQVDTEGSTIATDVATTGIYIDLENSTTASIVSVGGDLSVVQQYNSQHWLVSMSGTTGQGTVTCKDTNAGSFDVYVMSDSTNYVEADGHKAITVMDYGMQGADHISAVAASTVVENGQVQVALYQRDSNDNLIGNPINDVSISVSNGVIVSVNGSTTGYENLDQTTAQNISLNNGEGVVVVKATGAIDSIVTVTPNSGSVTAGNDITSQTTIVAPTTLAIVGYGPMNGDVNVPSFAPIDFFFNTEPSGSFPLTNTSTSNFSIVDGDGVAVTGQWSSGNHSWSGNTEYFVSFNATSGFSDSMNYTASVKKTIVSNTSLDSFMPALTSTELVYSFSFATGSGGGNYTAPPDGGGPGGMMGGWMPGMDNQFTGDMGGSFPPMAFLDYPMPNSWDVPTNVSAIIVGFDRPMDTTTFANNIYIKKMVSGSESAILPSGTVTLTPSADNRSATITGYTYEANSEYRVIVTRDVRDSNNEQLAGMPEGGGFGFGFGNMGSFKESFNTGSGSVTINASLTGSNLDAYMSGGLMTGVPTGFEIRANFDNTLNPATVNTTNVTLKKNNTLNIGGTVNYNAMDGNSIKFMPNTVLLPNTSYTFAISTAVKSISGQAITAVSKTFTTGAADTTDPQVVWADADNYGLFIQFDESLVTSTAESGGNYTLKTCVTSGCDASAGTQQNLQSGVNFHYESMNNEVMVDGLTLTPGHGFYIEVSTGVTDLSGNGVATGFKSWSGVVMDGANFAGGQGMFNMGSMGFEDFNMGSMGMEPINVMPMNQMAGATSVYFVDVPINTAIPANGTLELQFPAGFNISGAKQDQYSPMNADFNGPGPGTVTFASADPTGTGVAAGGTPNDGIGVAVGARKVIIKLSVATQSKDFLSLDLDGIINSSEPKGFETSGYQVNIQTKDSSGALIEAMTSMPFFLSGAGTNTISGTVKTGVTGLNGVRVFLGSPMTGPMEALTSLNGAVDLVAGNNAGEYKFENLPAGNYQMWTEPMFTVGSADYYGQDWPEPIYVSGGETKNFTVQEASSDNGATVTVTITGTVTNNAPANLGFNDSIDIFAGSPRGFVVKTLTRVELIAHIADSSANPITLYLPQTGDWNVGMGPAMPKGPMMSAMPEIDWLPSQPTNLMVTNSPWLANPSTVGFSFASADKTITGHVLDGSANAVANAEVFANSPNGGGMGSHTKTKSDGAYTLNVAEGSYIVGAFLPGMPSSQEISVVVTSSAVYASGSPTATTNVILKVAKPDYTITGRVTDGTNIISNAAVWAHRTDGPGHADGRTDSTGNYTIYVGAGTWQLEANAPSYGYLGSKTLTVSTESLTGQNFSPSSDLGSISGTIDIPGTSDDSGIMVHAWGPGGGNETKTGSDGTYKINYLPYATYTVEAFIPGIGNLASLTVVVDGDETGKNLTVAQPRTITVTLNSSVNGDSFVDFFSTSGIGNGLKIPSGETSRKIQLPDGVYYINAFMPGVNFDAITITSDGYSASTKQLTVNGDESITITLPTLYAISGQVKVGGTGVNDAWVWVQNDSTKEYFGVATSNDGNSDGMYSLNAPNGTYKMGVDKPGYISVPQEVVLNGANQSSINFSLTANDRTIIGTVTDGANPVANARIWAEKTGGGWSGTETDPDGTYILSVTSGTWSIKAVAKGYAEATALSANTSSGNITGKNFSLTLLTGAAKLKNPISQPLTPSAGGTIKNTSMGINIVVPPQALGSGSSSGQFSVSETNSIPSTTSSKPLSGKGKSITALDENGNPITQLNGDIEITMEYTTSTLAVDEIDTLTEQKKMSMGYWDNSTNNWVNVPTTMTYYSGDTIVEVDAVLADMSNISEVKFKASVNHLTTFAAIIPQTVTIASAGTPGSTTSTSGSAPYVGPTNISISINNGGLTTDSRNVFLSLSAVDAVKMIISNSSDFSQSVWQDYATSMSWVLSDGDGEKIVYVKYMDASSNQSSLVSDSIILEELTGVSAEVLIFDQDLVKIGYSSAVYLILNGQRHVFPHIAVYNSWNYSKDFSSVKTVTENDLTNFTEGDAVPFRDGSMFRGTALSLYGQSASAVFYVEDATLRPVQSGEIYQELFDDSNWELVTWVPDDLLDKFEYPLGTAITSADTHPNGCLVKYTDSSAVYLVSNGELKPFASWSALISNKYEGQKIFTIPITETYTIADAITILAESLITPVIIAGF